VHVRRAVSLSGLRLAGCLVLAVLLAQVHVRHRPATVCLLRATTGIPCPFCGGTTAAAHVGAGQLGAALRASPLALVGTPVVAALPVLRDRLVLLPPRVRGTGLALALLASEVWQLHRFGWF
jgi:hypothetical protein